MRRVVKWVLGIAGLVLVMGLGFGGYVAWSYLSATVDTTGEVDFDRPLAIPPLAESTVDAEGRRVFDLTLQRGESDFGRGAPTPTWGVNGSYLGPTLRAARGEQVLLNVTNHLGEESSLHWHGMHLPAAMDGGPHQPVADDATWSPTWQVDQPAATLWYHPHPHGTTAEHVYRGVAGMFILDDDREVSLPSEYGVDDVPVIVQDKEFDGSELDTSHSLFESTGILGDTILVNGTPSPYLDVTTELVRLRVLNASNARIYNFHFDDDRPYHLVGTDGGLLPEPVELTRLVLSPGERAEIVVAMTPGDRTVLRSAPLESDHNRFAGTEDRFDVLELRASEELAESPDLPAELAPAPDLDRSEVTATRDFALQSTRINGREMDMSRIDETIEVGATELWRVRNSSGNLHNFHVHDVQFAVATLNGDEPPPELRGWKDTIFIPPNREVELLMRFTDYSDPDVPYMFHCHLLRHEDEGMMGQFVVVDPGKSAGTPDAAGHDH
jgi:FtsP/CotA-like multicopper oxidase with cupredoxin domain